MTRSKKRRVTGLSQKGAGLPLVRGTVPTSRALLVRTTGARLTTIAVLPAAMAVHTTVHPDFTIAHRTSRKMSKSVLKGAFTVMCAVTCDTKTFNFIRNHDDQLFNKFKKINIA